MSDYEFVNHPPHYGGNNDPYEHRKVARAWGLGYELGCCTKYICRAGKKPGTSALQDLRKAANYLQAEIDHLQRLENERQGDLSLHRNFVQEPLFKSVQREEIQNTASPDPSPPPSVPLDAYLQQPWRPPTGRVLGGEESAE